MLEKEAVFVLIYFIITIFVLILFIVVFAISFQRRKNKMLMEQIAAEQAYEQELVKSQMEIQETVLRNIAWELHDNVGQLLSVANLQLNLLSGRIPENFKDEIQETKDIIKQSVQEIRSLSKVLNNDVILKNGLVKSLETEIDRLNRLKYLKAIMTVEGEGVDIVNSTEIIIFRIIQESLSNILKHAKASKLFLLVSFQEEFLEIVLTDNGVGFDTSEKTDGSGMETMKNRAALIRALLTIDSDLGKGTVVSLKYFYKNGKEIG